LDIQQVIKVWQALLDGTNPDTGAVLPADSILHSPTVIRALARLVQSLEYCEGRNQEKQRKLPPNAGRAWTPEEDAQVCEELRKGARFAEIAKGHGRTNGAIVTRLVRLGKIPPNGVNVETPGKTVVSSVRSDRSISQPIAKCLVQNCPASVSPAGSGYCSKHDWERTGIGRRTAV
jgi:hypothetical protein